MTQTTPPPDLPSVDIGSLFDERPITPFQWRAILLCSLVALLDGMDMQLASLVVPTIASDWGLKPASFGFMLSAGLIGLGFAAAMIAPLGDRFGRRPVILGGFILVGIGSLATAFCSGLGELTICRLITGAGLGASLPNATALTSEFAPVRYRSRLLVVMYANMGMGSILAGFMTPPILLAHGWPAVFLVGGALPLALCVLLYWQLPESLPFLLQTKPTHPRLAGSLARTRPDLQVNMLVQSGGQSRRVRWADVLSPKFRRSTLLLWLVYFLITFLLYLLLSWLPTLLRSVGWLTSQAVMGAVTLSIGGVIFGICQGWMADKGFQTRALLAGFTTSTIAFLGFAIVPPIHSLWIVLIVMAGAGTSGATFAMSALSARIYPVEIRAGGVGIAAAVARIGAVFAPIAGSAMLGLGMTPRTVLVSLSAPMAACIVVVALYARWLRPNDAADGALS